MQMKPGVTPVANLNCLNILRLRDLRSKLFINVNYCNLCISHHYKPIDIWVEVMLSHNSKNVLPIETLTTTIIMIVVLLTKKILNVHIFYDTTHHISLLN